LKIEITLDHSEVKAAISASLTAHGYTVPDDASFSIDLQGNVTVTVLSSAKSGGLTASHIADPGAPYSVRCVATCFGFKDPGDNGVGAFTDQTTGKPYDTNNDRLIGVSVPIPILWDTIGAQNYDLISHKSVVAGVIAIQTGKCIAAQIVDLGPGESVDGKHALLVGKDGVGHYLDLTAAACDSLGVKYDPATASHDVIWWLQDANGKPFAMKGLDAPKKVVS